MRTKKCKKCEEVLPIGAFGKNTKAKDGKNARCKLCINALDKVCRDRNKNKTPARFNHMNSMKSLRRDYGITEWVYQEMLNDQNDQKGLCAICEADFGAPLEPKRPDGRQAHIDHDHNTGIVRGLLCMNCNIALGHLEKTSVPILGIVRYLDATL